MGAKGVGNDQYYHLLLQAVSQKDPRIGVLGVEAAADGTWKQEETNKESTKDRQLLCELLSGRATVLLMSVPRLQRCLCSTARCQ